MYTYTSAFSKVPLRSLPHPHDLPHAVHLSGIFPEVQAHLQNSRHAASADAVPGIFGVGSCPN